MDRAPAGSVFGPRSVLILFMLLLLAALSRFATLGSYSLIDPTESRYSEIAREMVVTNEWIVPHLSPAKPFWGKPPLSFWATALIFKTVGISDLTARLSSFFFATLTVGLLFLVGLRLRGVAFGLLCAVVLATGALFYVLAGGVMTDPSLMATVTVSMAAFALAALARTPKSRRVWGYAFFAGLGLSLLSKGPIGAVVTLLPLAVWLAWRRKRRDVTIALPWRGGIALAAVLSVPWYAAAELRTPGFLKYFIVGEHFMRFLVSDWAGDLYGSPHEAPLGTIWVYLAIGTMPWGLWLAPAAWRFVRAGRALERVRDDPWLSYALLWMVSPALFFTVSKNVMLTYVLPGLPGFALAAAMALERLALGATEAGSGRAVASGAGGESGAMEASSGTPGAASGTQGTAHPPPISTASIRFQKWFLAFALFAPVVFCLAAVPVLQILDNKRSQHNLVDSFEQTSAYQGARLNYFEKAPPYSAEFYSEGRARFIPRDDLATLERVFNDEIADYFVLTRNDVKMLPTRYALRLKELDRAGKYGLFREQPASTPKPEPAAQTSATPLPKPR